MSTTLVIIPIGNLGNRMIQYLGARKIVSHCPHAVIHDAHLQEWGYPTNRDQVPPGKALTIRPDSVIPFKTLVDAVNSGNWSVIEIMDHLQRMDFMPSKEEANSYFPVTKDAYIAGADEIVINIRSAEVVLGIGHYPLVPIDYYKDVIRTTNLNPVFMGQLGENAYCRRIRELFPNAKFLESQGALRDFETIRTAAHIVPSVSTFSWLASWMSSALNIYLPVIGFYNPCHFKFKPIIDLLPRDDARYHFRLFPLHYGVPEEQDIESHVQLNQASQAVSARQLDALRHFAPMLKSDPLNVDFDERWYVHNYIEAAKQVSTGWFADGISHYCEIGINVGNKPLPAECSVTLNSIKPGAKNIALGKRATQSSISQWSEGDNVVSDASRANGEHEITPYAFHTSYEDHPWWMIDLNTRSQIDQVLIVNRTETEVVSGRSSPITISISDDLEMWSEVFTTPNSFIPGVTGRPLIWTPTSLIVGRYLRIQVKKKTFLHLKKVAIYGQAMTVRHTEYPNAI